MSKKGFIASLVLSVLVTLSLGIYTLVSLFYVPPQKTPKKPYEPTNTTIEYAFRSGDEVTQLNGYSEEDGTLTFIVEEGQTNPVSYNAETGKYTTGDVKGSVKAVVKINDKGDTNTYIISVYPHSDAGLTEDAPFIIANKTNLKEFVAIMNDTSAEARTIEAGDAILFAELVADIDIGGENWKPIGNRARLVENLTFKGNGHTIKNMTININKDNYQDYYVVYTRTADIQAATMDIGFFGSIYNSKVYGLNFDGAVINISKDVYDVVTAEAIPDGANYQAFDYVNVGVVTGRMTGGSMIEGVETKSFVNAKINAFSYTYETSRNSAGLGGIVGYELYSQVKNYNVNLNVVNNLSTVQGSNIGGIAGRIAANIGIINSDLYINTIQNCSVNLKVDANYANKSNIAGIVGDCVNTKIVDCTVESIVVKDTTELSDINFTLTSVTSVGGVAAIIDSVIINDAANGGAFTEEEFAVFKEKSKTNIKNVVVNDFDINMRGGVANGFALLVGSSQAISALVKIEDVKVSGTAYAQEAFGFAKEVKQNVEITYTESFSGDAINVNLTGVKVAGVSYKFRGTMSGYADAEDNKTQVKVKLRGLGALLSAEQVSDYAKRALAYGNTYATGLVTYLYTNGNAEKSNISNFTVDAIITNSLNMAGVAYKMVDGSVEKLNVSADITSYNYSKEDRNYSTTYMVAGVACLAETGSKIDSVNVNINVNNGVDKAVKYGATFFGGLVARIQNNGITLTNNTVSGNVYFNDTYYTVSWGEGQSYKAFVAGGLVGSFTSYAETTTNNGLTVDAFDKIAASDTVITNNNVSNLEIYADFDFSRMETRDCFRNRAVGILIGNYYSDDDLDLSTNTIGTLVENAEESAEVVPSVKIIAKVDAFTYGHVTSDNWVKVRTTLGYNTENKKIEYSFGISSKLNSAGGVITDVAADQLSKAEVVEIYTATAE